MSDPQKIMLGTASCKDLVQCMLNLGDLEMAILKRLIKKGALKSEDLTRFLKRDKSIVHRGLQKLMTCGLVVREKRNISKGGYYFIYSSIPTHVIKKRIKECIDTMYANMKEIVEDFDLMEDDRKAGPGRKRKK